jgi:hypothetical protein
MSSASSVLWVSALVAIAGSGVMAACASSPALEETPQPWTCATTGCGDSGAGGGDDGQSPDNSDDASSADEPANGGDDAGIGTSDDSGEPPTDAGGGGQWINMTNNASGCVNEPNVPCGYTATNEGQGYTCACRQGTEAVGWNCEPPGAPVVSGPSCPGVVGNTDAAVGSDDAGTASGDSGGGGGTDAGGWINVSTNSSACVNEPGVPCGYTATNEGQGYICMCYNGNWAVPWACEPGDASVTPGPGCP